MAFGKPANLSKGGCAATIGLQRLKDVHLPPSACMFHQSGVLPYRIEAGQLEILLITSTRRKRWVIPKGWVELSMTPADSAAKEAREEAGIVGIVNATSIGFYTVRKLGIPLKVEVFPMRVETELDRWKEINFRQRQWFSPAEAIKLVKKRQLKQLIQQWEQSSTTASSP